jgi:hypothetical protein
VTSASPLLSGAGDWNVLKRAEGDVTASNSVQASVTAMGVVAFRTIAFQPF